MQSCEPQAAMYLWFKSGRPCLFHSNLLPSVHCGFSKWMTSAVRNVRMAKAKIISTKTVREAHHYVLGSCMSTEQCTR